jgi:hypothetical protein
MFLKKTRFSLITMPLLGLVLSLNAQSKADNLIYVDKNGILRYTKGNKEAAFFGVNYTVPFAYSFRAHKALGVEIKKAIQQDVYHLSRLGIDAFRVHVWDTEITDSIGNLLENEHLELFDFLLAELKKRNIKTIITPLAFWGNGYPEKDEKTLGFSSIYNKNRVVVEEAAIKAQENYLIQFFKHVNPFTKLTYLQDQDIVATEINNEPKHSGSKQGVTNYINRLHAAIKSVGWSKPIFYNISESPAYADAVSKSNVDGVSFQWYPTGLVANREVKGNFLPHVNQYTIPFDTIPAYAKKAKMVYEFDAADILQSIIYPFIAKSFRKAGFQWATQFAYDPLAIAYANTEYQTHYLNLAYTPNKAISLLIAGKAFHQIPRLRDYGTYPIDSVFDAFRVSYKESLSEMNTPEEFYYSNPTNTKPISVKQLKKLAGVGSSPIVNYSGIGAYFLDQLENGIWRLEVMPDAISIRDPFEKASLKKEVTRIEWRNQIMKIDLVDLGSNFNVSAINVDNTYSTVADNGSFAIKPGTYIIAQSNKSIDKWSATSIYNNIKVGEFVAPKPIKTDIFLNHQAIKELTANEAYNIKAKIVGANEATKVSLAISSPLWKTIEMKAENTYDYSTIIPAELLNAGVFRYKIIIQQGDNYQTFPGNHSGNPYAWDNYINENWESLIVPKNADLEIYNASINQNINVFPSQWGNNVKVNYSVGASPRQVLWSISTQKLENEHVLGFQHEFTNQVKGRQSEADAFTKVVIRARTFENKPIEARIAFVNKNASAFAAKVMLTNQFQDIEIPLSALNPDAMLLLPRPYPGFMPLWFKSNSTESFKLADAEKVEFTIGSTLQSSAFNQPYSFQIESIILKK